MPQKSKFLLALAVVFGVLALAVAPAAAQVLYGSIVGTVEDPSGALIPGATVTIVNKETSQTREVTADEAGRFTVPNVLPGKYDLRVTATGFKPVVLSNIDVTFNTVTRQAVRMEVGSITEAVEVSASAVQLQTDKSDVRHAISTTAMTQLPLPGYRNYQALMNLVPGATPADYQNSVVDTPARSLTTNVNGTARNINNTLIDGAANTFIWLPHHTYYVPPVDSIQEVNVSTGSFDAEQGLAGGAAITLMTKSGTNEIHGTGMWYHNNQHLNGGPYFRSKTFKVPVSALNQGNGTIGGPIKKDKLFYFVSYERTWERTGVAATDLETPPAAWRDGDLSSHLAYSQIYDPATTRIVNGKVVRDPFSGNIIPKSRISPIFQNIIKGLPLPNQTSLVDSNINLQDTYSTSGTMKLDRHMLDVKSNWNATSKLAVWGKFSYMNAPVSGKYAFGDLGGPALGTDGFGDTKTYIPTVGFTYTVSPTFLIDGVFGITRFDQTVGIPQSDSNVGLDTWGIPGTNGGRQYADDIRYGGLPNIQGFGFSQIGVAATWAPLFRRERTYEYRTNFSKIQGAHELRWGFEPRRYSMSHWQPETANPRGEINFASGATVIDGQTGREPNQFASALLGLVSSYYKSIQFLMMETREWQFGTYVQDRWQASRKLTLNLGLRYEYFPLINRGDRGIERWDPYTNIVYMGGLGDVPRNAGITVSKKLFAPRVGFAYRLTDNWVVRSGYGITYNAVPFSRPLRGLYPATLTASWSASSSDAAMRDSSYGWYNSLAQGIPDVPTPDISQGTLELPLSLDMGPRSPWGGELKRGYIQSWNFTVSRKLPMDAVLDIAYVGTRTIRQMMDRNINTSGPGEDVNTMNRALAKLYGKTIAANMWDGIGYAAYDSLQTSLNKNFTNGLFLKTSYTWGKAMNMADDDGWVGVRGWSWEPMLSRNYTRAGYDRRHMFTLAWVYDMPFGQGKKWSSDSKIVDHILGGWKLNGIFSMYSGTPFSVTGSGSSLRCAGCTQTADQIGEVKKIDTERGPGKVYYDPSAFMDPLVYFNKTGVYRSGTMGLNVLSGPGFWRLDPALFKEFKISERIRTEFRAEAFNVTNTPRWNNPNGGAASPTRDADGNITSLNNFMAITGVASNNFGGMAGRQFRFGARIQF